MWRRRAYLGKGTEEEELSGCLMGRDLYDVEILLGDQVPFHTETELVATGGRKDQRRHINPEIRDLQTVRDHYVREGSTADELFAVEVNEIDVEPVSAFRVGQAEVQAHLLVLEWKARGLQMREQADQALFLGPAVFDDLVANKERLHAGCDDFRHHTYSTGVSQAVKGICLSVGNGRWEGPSEASRLPRSHHGPRPHHRTSSNRCRGGNNVG